MEHLKRRGLWMPLTGLLQAVGFAILPKCPLCVAAYLGAFGASGLVARMDSQTLLWASLISMAVAVGTFAYLAAINRRPWAFGLGGIAIALIAAGKYLSWRVGSYLGFVTLVLAAAVNVALTRPRRLEVSEEPRRGDLKTRSCCG